MYLLKIIVTITFHAAVYNRLIKLLQCKFLTKPTNFEMDIKWENENKPNIIQFSKDGDMAYSLDRNETSAPDSTGKMQKIPNKVLHIWKKDKEGNWKVSLLMVCPEK